MSDALLRDLPRPLPAFVRRFGTDAKCRAYVVRALWPDGFRCTGCGHREAWSHQKRLIEECRACGKQHSILAGTMVEQTKPGLSKWFLAIHLVTFSKGGISAMELQRQMGFASYGTALRRLPGAVPVPDASAASLEGFIAAATEKPLAVATDGWAGYRGLDGKGYSAAISPSVAMTGQRRISRDGMVSVDGNLQSVPDSTLRRTVEVQI